MNRFRFPAFSHTHRLFAMICALGLMLVGFIGILVSLASINAIEKNSISANRRMLLQYNNSINAVISQMENIPVQCANDQRILNFMRYYENMDIDSINIASHKLQSLLVNSDYIHSIALYYPSLDKAYVVNSGILPLDSYYDADFMRSLPLLSPDQRGAAWTAPRLVYDGLQAYRELELISLVRPIQLGGGLETELVISLNASYITSMFDSVASGEHTAYLAVDSRGVLMAGSTMGYEYAGHAIGLLELVAGSDEGNTYFRLDDERMLVSYITCPQTGWKYFSITPQALIYQDIYDIMRISVIVILTGMLLAILMSRFVSRHIAAPVVRLAQQFDIPDSAGPDIVDHIETGIRTLREHNESIQKSLEESLPVLRNKFLSGLLDGIVTDPMEIDEKLRYFGLEAMPGSVCAYILLINDRDAAGNRYSPRQLSTFTIYVVRELEEALAGQGHFIFCNNRDYETTIIAFLDNGVEEAERVMEIGRLLEQTIAQDRKYFSAIGVGNAAPSIYGISTSYYSARHALAYRYLQGGGQLLYWADGENVPQAIGDYPFAQEEKMIEYMRQGRLDKAKESIAKILAPLEADPAHWGKRRIYYLLQLMGAVTKFAFECGAAPKEGLRVSEAYDELLSKSGNDSLQGFFNDLLEQIHTYNLVKQSRLSRPVCERIVEYIQENYAKDLSLSHLSELFYFSAPYISRIFREETGCSVKQYITKIRMEQACKLLENPGQKINTIARLVGYEKVPSFLKQFKEVVGMTPSAYREQLTGAKGQEPQGDSPHS